MSQSPEEIVKIEWSGAELLYYAPDCADHIQRVLRGEKRLYEENALVDVFSRDLKRGSVIDVGANIGNHTVFFGRILKRRVIALEPYEKAFRVLETNVELNGLSGRVTLLQKAAGKSRGRGRLQAPPEGNWGQARLIAADDGPVEVIRLDDLDVRGPVALVKIDVEGMEADVLEGARRLLKRKQPVVYVEAQTALQYGSVRRILRSLGYEMVRRFNHTPTFVFLPCSTKKQRTAALFEMAETMASLEQTAIHQHETMRALSRLEPALAKSFQSSLKTAMEQHIGVVGAQLQSFVDEHAKQVSDGLQAARREISGEFSRRMEELQTFLRKAEQVVRSLEARQEHFKTSFDASIEAAMQRQATVLAAQLQSMIEANVQHAITNLQDARREVSGEVTHRIEESQVVLHKAERLLESLTATQTGLKRSINELKVLAATTRQATPASPPNRDTEDGLALRLPFDNVPLEIVLQGHGIFSDAAPPQQPILEPHAAAAISLQEGSYRSGQVQNGDAAARTDDDKITVIMTTFNSARFVAQAVQNVLEQTHRNLELIVVDDASTDDTFDALVELARNDSRIRPIKMFKNRGTYWCKNYAITRSTGRYITFQDSDDASAPDRLERQLHELQVHNCVMCTCNYVRVDASGNVLLNRGLEERKAIMAPLLDKQEILRQIGYFDSVRTSADDEFTRRIGIAFGQGRICHIDMPLYRATVRDGSLTNDDRTKADISVADGGATDHSFLSAPRREYVRQYSAWHEQLKRGNDRPQINFPQLRRPFPAPARLLPQAHHEDCYVTASMASFPARRPLLAQTVDSILPQVDFLNIYLNGYDETPGFLCSPKIHVIHSREYGDLRDNGKFFFLDSVPWGYHFTIDDDIIYPSDYVQKMVLKIEQYDRKAIVGCHGVIFATPFVEFMKGREVFHFKRGLANDRLVNLLGTGTTAYHVSAISLSRDDFREAGMADLWLAVAAKRQRLPMIAIERPDGWLLPLAEADETSLYSAALNQCQLQTTVVRNEEPWRLDELCSQYPFIQDLLSRFGAEQLRAAGFDATALLQLAGTC